VKRGQIATALVAIGFALAIGAVIVRATNGSERRTVPALRPYLGSTPPPGLRLPRFSLRSYGGNTVATDALRGKVTLITFLDTKCTEKCPVFASQIASALRLLPRRERRQVVALAISVDPRVDSPGSVRRFLETRHALGELDFLLGSIRQLRTVWRAFHIVPAADTGDADVHSSDARVFDRRGIWVSTFHAGVDLSPQNVAHDLLTALKRNASRSTTP
jgi:cytochrome oxidase Cu insertion factor (SCO1/SenC/PrrC family)